MGVARAGHGSGCSGWREKQRGVLPMNPSSEQPQDLNVGKDQKLTVEPPEQVDALMVRVTGGKVPRFEETMVMVSVP